jgi:hypothetical protein
VAVKIVAILANFPIGRRRIIAGREFTKKDGQLSLGPWIRPVADLNQADLDLNGSLLNDRTQPVILDLVQISFAHQQNDPYRPENCCVQKATPWKRLSSLQAKFMRILTEKPDTLWLEENSPTDRVSDLFLNSMQKMQSVYLIRPQQFHLVCCREDNPLKFDHQYPHRAVLRYNNSEYDLPISDPVIEEKYFSGIADGENTGTTIELKRGSNCLICVALTSTSQGSHQKVVTTVIEPEY